MEDIKKKKILFTVESLIEDLNNNPEWLGIEKLATIHKLKNGEVVEVSINIIKSNLSKYRLRFSEKQLLLKSLNELRAGLSENKEAISAKKLVTTKKIHPSDVPFQIQLIMTIDQSEFLEDNEIEYVKPFKIKKT